MLLTTSVGSFPKPDYLVRARARFARNEISRAELRSLELRATAECIALQEDIGLDILVDGEMERGDMTTYFAENYAGMTISGLVRSYGNRYYHKPIVVGPIERSGPVTLEIYRYAQGLTGKPVKGMLTGPYTMMDWSFNEYYPDRRATTLAFASVIHDEAVDLEKAGATYIQIDEPAISTRPDEIDLAIDAMAVVTKGLHARTITHICYGDFTPIYPRLLDLPVDQFDLELTNSDFVLLDLFRQYGFTKEIGLGVVDSHNHMTESKEQIKASIRRAMDVIPAQRIYVDPDCGLKTRTLPEAEAKLRVMVEAVRELRKEIGG
jgi:5-methyltetrahydropteroyltriglutamate--homocysteine methyltransferase